MQYMQLDHIRAYAVLEDCSLFFETNEGEQAFYDQTARRFVRASDLPARHDLDWYRDDNGTFHALIDGLYEIPGYYLDEWEENADDALAELGVKLGPVVEYSELYAINHYRLEPID